MVDNITVNLSEIAKKVEKDIEGKNLTELEKMAHVGVQTALAVYAVLESKN